MGTTTEAVDAIRKAVEEATVNLSKKEQLDVLSEIKGDLQDDINDLEEEINDEEADKAAAPAPSAATDTHQEREAD